MVAVGDLVGPLTVGPIAHGGHFVAHHDGRVLFVRHALPHEDVIVRITGVSASVLRGEAVEVHHPSPDRVTPACPVFVPGGCGGCDFQHVSLPRQRDFKTTVVADQLHRLAGITWEGQVEPVPGDVGGFEWRTRVRYLLRGEQLGMREHRSHRFVQLPEEGCRLAVEALRRPRLNDGRIEVVRDSGRGRRGRPDRELAVAVGPDGRVLPVGSEAQVRVRGRDYWVNGSVFWQLHPGAPEALTAAVIEGLEPKGGETALDLYCGSGLFAGALSDRGVQVTGVEAHRRAIDLARRNVPEARFQVTEVVGALPTLPSSDLIVVDPPRSGVGRKAMATLLSTPARALAYVACDPAALARDLADLPAGWSVGSIRAFDLFPMTHHVETVAILRRETTPADDETAHARG